MSDETLEKKGLNGMILKLKSEIKDLNPVATESQIFAYEKIKAWLEARRDKAKIEKDNDKLSLNSQLEEQYLEVAITKILEGEKRG